MESSVVVNKYQGGLGGYRFEWNGSVYRIDSSEPYKLIIKKENGGVYASLGVDSYYDCGVLIGDVFFWGERLGKICGYSMSARKVCFCSYINEEAEAFYQYQAAKYPYTFPPKSSSYDYLPEINLANYVISKISITVQVAYQHYLVVGDLSGRVSFFDVTTRKRVKTFTVDGAVVGIKVEGGKAVIDYIQSDYLDSPSYLSEFKNALRTCIDVAL